MDNVQLNVNFLQLIAAIKRLSPKEKLQVNEAIWEENLDIPIEHQALVLED